MMDRTARWHLLLCSLAAGCCGLLARLLWTHTGLPAGLIPGAYWIWGPPLFFLGGSLILWTGRSAGDREDELVRWDGRQYPLLLIPPVLILTWQAWERFDAALAVSVGLLVALRFGWLLVAAERSGSEHREARLVLGAGWMAVLLLPVVGSLAGPLVGMTNPPGSLVAIWVILAAGLVTSVRSAGPGGRAWALGAILIGLPGLAAGTAPPWLLPAILLPALALQLEGNAGFRARLAPICWLGAGLAYPPAALPGLAARGRIDRLLPLLGSLLGLILQWPAPPYHHRLRVVAAPLLDAGGGLLPAWPVALVGLAGLIWHRRRSSRGLAGGVVLMAVAGAALAWLRPDRWATGLTWIPALPILGIGLVEARQRIQGALGRAWLDLLVALGMIQGGLILVGGALQESLPIATRSLSLALDSALRSRSTAFLPDAWDRAPGIPPALLLGACLALGILIGSALLLIRSQGSGSDRTGHLSAGYLTAMLVVLAGLGLSLGGARTVRIPIPDPVRLDRENPEWSTQVDQDFPVRVLELGSRLSCATGVRQERGVAEVELEDLLGNRVILPVQAGRHTAEWAWDRPDVRDRVAHDRPRVHWSRRMSLPWGKTFQGHAYTGLFRLEQPRLIRRITLRLVPPPEAPACFDLILEDLRLVEDDGLAPDRHGRQALQEGPVILNRHRREIRLPFEQGSPGRRFRLLSYLANSLEVPEGTVVARVFLQDALGTPLAELPIRAGGDTAEWALLQGTIRERARHRPARIERVEREFGEEGRRRIRAVYRSDRRLPRTIDPTELRIRLEDPARIPGELTMTLEEARLYR